MGRIIAGLLAYSLYFMAQETSSAEINPAFE